MDINNEEQNEIEIDLRELFLKQLHKMQLL